MTGESRKGFQIVRGEDESPGSPTKGLKRKEGQKTHASTLSSAIGASITASINAITLCESTNAAADVVAEDAFVAGVGHGCLESFFGKKMRLKLRERVEAWNGKVF